MISGITLDGIRSAIRTKLETFDRVGSVWGFGSFFRNENYRDVDILIVVIGAADAGLLAVSRAIRAQLLELERAVGVPIDPLIVTEAEFKGGPLRDMHELVGICGYTTPA